MAPAGSGFDELVGGEAPDDEFLALDPAGGFAVEVCADRCRGGSFDRSMNSGDTIRDRCLYRYSPYMADS